jgi:hypothetical protein
VTSNDDQLLAEVSQVLKGGDTLRAACRKLLTVISPSIDAITTDVDIQSPDIQTTFRCIIKRVQENLEAIIDMTESKHPHMSTMMLRPLCEDLIYGAWLRTLPKDASNELIALSTAADITKSIMAQLRFLPKAYAEFGKLPDGTFGATLSGVMSADGFGRNLSNAEARYNFLKSELKDLGLRLGWPNGKQPSVYRMAEQANLSEVYDFFYHGSSKAVHANLHNMSRMILNDPQQQTMTVDSHLFDKYSTSFALTYGFWLSAKIIEEIARTEFPEESNLIDDKAYSVWLAVVLAGLARRGQLPPIVAKEELWWPLHWH